MAAAAPAAWGPEQLAWRSADMRYALPLCTAISVLAHVLVLATRVAPEPPRQAARAGSGAGAQTIQLRLLPPQAAVAPPTFSEALVTPGAAMPVPVAPASRAMPAAATPKLDVAKDPVGAAAPEAGPKVPAADGSTAHAAQDEYIPRPLLSVAPVAQTPVLLAAPPGETGVARHSGILSLFIDEDGQVRRVTASGPSLPPAFEQAARDAFMAARFAPGQLDGHAVKSRIRVEVVFDNTTLLAR